MHDDLVKVTEDKTELARSIAKGMFYLSCRMTISQIEKMRRQKEMFSELD